MNAANDPKTNPVPEEPGGANPVGSGGIDYGRVGVQLGVLAAVLAVGGGVLGYLLAGGKGLWGALMGAVIVGAFFGASAVVMHLSKTAESKARNLLIAWFAKLVGLFVIMLALNQATFISRPALGITILVGVIGSLVLEGRVVWSARITPGPGQTPGQRP
ncbi:MAG: hypothetical protein LBC97_00685 [Bifidobacteriaceae bacterium]|jgi:hypothetical protein|nr:hypothetical protein [Bifidobacteriaceae bacterium]